MELKSFPPSLDLNCLKCDQPASIRTYLQCITYVCPECGCGHTFRNNKLQKKGGLESVKKEAGYIPIGSSGKIKDRIYQVVGFAIKKELGQTYKWREYLLFSPYYGYAFLSEYDGHWTFLEQLIVHPKEVIIPKDVTFDSKWFRFFNNYRSKLVYAAGEFCYDIFEEGGSIKELVSSPYMLSYELTSDEQMWFLGEYIEGKEIQRAFGIPNDAPKKTGVGMCQPMKLSFDYNVLKTLTVVFLILLVSVQIIMSNTNAEREVLSDYFTFQTSSSGKPGPLLSRTFEVTNGPTNIELCFSTPVDNSWMDFNVDLVNETTSEHFEFNTTAEYYHGYEDGENWSEGSSSVTADLSQIPSGKYHLNIWAERETMFSGDYFNVVAKTGQPIYSNMFIAAGILLLFPLITYYRRNYFEERRWYNSNYSPYE